MCRRMVSACLLLGGFDRDIVCCSFFCEIGLIGFDLVLIKVLRPLVLAALREQRVSVLNGIWWCCWDSLKSGSCWRPGLLRHRWDWFQTLALGTSRSRWTHLFRWFYTVCHLLEPKCSFQHPACNMNFSMAIGLISKTKWNHPQNGQGRRSPSSLLGCLYRQTGRQCTWHPLGTAV